MKITLTKEQFEAALPEALRGITPILSTTLLVAYGGKLTGYTTNLDVCLSSESEVNEIQHGSICINSAKLSQLVKSLPPGEISLETTDTNSLKIKAGPVKAELLGLDATEFPSFPKVPKKAEWIEFEAGHLQQLLSQLAYAISTDKTRETLLGANFNRCGEELELVASDGKRIVLVKTGKTVKTAGQIVPGQIVQHIQKLVGAVKICFGENAVFAEANGRKVYGKLIEGTYMALRKAIPETDLDIEFDREELLSTVARVGIGTDEKMAAIRLDFAKDQVTLVCNSPAVGRIEQGIAIKNDRVFSTAYNPKYLSEMLRTIPGKTVTGKFKDAITPGYFSAPGIEVLILTMRVQ